jgi:hypothetical protein
MPRKAWYERLFKEFISTPLVSRLHLSPILRLSGREKYYLSVFSPLSISTLLPCDRTVHGRIRCCPDDDEGTPFTGSFAPTFPVREVLFFPAMNASEISSGWERSSKYF